MPAGKKQQNNTILYSLIAFVGVFLIATAFAIVFYVKFEEQKKLLADSEKKLAELANGSEQRNLRKIVGPISRGKTGLGAMNDYLNNVIKIITGGEVENTNAQIKVGNTLSKAATALDTLAKDYEDYRGLDANSVGLIHVVSKLKTDLDNVTSQSLATNAHLEYLQDEFDDALAVSLDKEQKLSEEKERFHQQVLNIEQKYNALRQLMEQTAEGQVNTLVVKLEEQQENSNLLKQDLLKTQAQLKMTQEKMGIALAKVRDLEPLPDKEAAALKPDGKIMMINKFAKVVHLNIGSDSHVYPGLTFAVYDRTAAIPRNGMGKGEVEVFDVEKTFSIARIVDSKISNPILLDDNIANLIWDSKKKNIFVVAGDFDLDGDNNKDYNGVEKIKTLIGKWGGIAEEDVTVKTDFLVIGSPPRVRRKPTFEEMEMYPTAVQRYEESLKKLQHYKDVQEKAKSLSVPMFNYSRFLYLIGYKSQSVLDGAF